MKSIYHICTLAVLSLVLLVAAPNISRAQYQGYGGSTELPGDYGNTRVKMTPEEKRADYLQRAGVYRQKADAALAKGAEKVAKYQKRAEEERMEAAEDAGDNPGRAIIIMSKGEDKVDKYNRKADAALAKAQHKADRYLAEAEKLEQKASEIGI